MTILSSEDPGLARFTAHDRVDLYAALHGTPLERLMAIAREFSPRIERHGATDVALDVSGLGRLLGDGHAIGEELARAGADRVAVTASQIGARLLARANPGVSVPGTDPGDVARALSVLPLPVLKQVVVEQGIDADADVVFDILRRWGLRTLGEFAALPAADLSARLGQRGVALQQLARGIDARPLVPDCGVPRFVESLELEWPIESLEPLSFVFARLLDPLSGALERADRGAAAIRLDLRLADRTIHTRVLQLPAAMRDPRILRTLLLLDLESNPPSAAVDVVTIEADPAPGRILQYSLLERAVPSAETLATLTARLGALVGTDRCGVPSLVDSHRPDEFGLGSAGSLGSTGSMGSCGATGRLRASEPNPSNLTPILRRFRPPVAVRVTLEGGRPVRIAIDRQGMPGGGVTAAAGPWRTSGAWWDQSSPRLRSSSFVEGAKAGGAPWDRDEWDVRCTDGTACRIYRDRQSGVWFLDGVFD